jgi:high frequency lysogenization protein
MPQTDHDRVIALAGMFQATQLVSSIARTGEADPLEVATCLGSLFKFDAGSSDEIYGGVWRLHSGLQLLIGQLKQPRDMEITRYVLALLVLERKLRKHPEFLAKIRRQIEATADKLHYFELAHDNVVAGLADTYASTVSTLAPRIMVNGEHIHLAKQENANRIRALLLAGIRAAVLWRQSGGSRLLLLMRRKALLLAAQRLLDQADSRAQPGDVPN